MWSVKESSDSGLVLLLCLILIRGRISRSELPSLGVLVGNKQTPISNKTLSFTKNHLAVRNEWENVLRQSLEIITPPFLNTPKLQVLFYIWIYLKTLAKNCLWSSRMESLHDGLGRKDLILFIPFISREIWT